MDDPTECDVESQKGTSMFAVLRAMRGRIRKTEYFPRLVVLD